MKWRVIVRVSLDGKSEATIIRKDITDALLQACILKKKKKTRSYEGQPVDPLAAYPALREVIKMLADKSSAAKSGVCLDHLWILIDRVDEPVSTAV